MQINFLDRYQNSIPSNRTLKLKNVSAVSNYKKINFCASINPDSLDITLSKGLSKLKKYTKEEYQRLNKQEIKQLRQEYKKIADRNIYYVQKEESHEITSERIKDYCNEKYGEDNYKIITIGRSLSTIGKVLGYKIGEENVINLPLSDAGKYLNKKYTDILKKDGEIDRLREFLSTIGLSKDDRKLSGKHYVIMDYSATGKSLKGATRLLTRSDVLGTRHVHSLSVCDCMTNFLEENRLNSELSFCTYKPYAFVSRAENLRDIPEAMKIPERHDTESRLFLFKLLDNQMNHSKLKSKSDTKKPNIIQRFLQRIFT